MPDPAVTLPPLAAISNALRKTTESLAHEVACPTAKTPQWTDFEWRIGRAAAAMQGISSLLYSGLCWDGPESWLRFLREQQTQSVRRHEQIACLVDAIDSQARREGVALVALKGAALLAKGIYSAGARPMGDIDLLIRSEDANATARLLESCGYEIAFASKRHQVFKPKGRKVPMACILGEHVDNPINIEVHTRIAEQLPVAAVDITQFIYPADVCAGLNPYASTVSLMMHLLLHAAGNMRARALRFIQLHDIALLAARFKQDDWEQLLATRQGGSSLWWAFAPLAVTARYYPATIPPAILARLSVECPWVLRKLATRRQLTDISWSNIRIAAFPGIEWSRSSREAFEFMASRVWPSRKMRQELRVGAAEIPGVASVPWYGISHGARVLRWIFSRPPRVQTILPVRAALAQES
jgi:hypothetical protein